MATDVTWTESKLPLELIKQYFIKTYHSGTRNIEDARKFYFELIELNTFTEISNKRDRHNAYREFIEKPILEGGLGTTEPEFLKYFRDYPDVLDKHRELWSKGEGGNGGNRYVRTNNNIISSKPNTIQGTSLTYSIQRLRTEGHTELAQKVISKEISANKAMIQAGLRVPTITVKQTPEDFARAALKVFTDEELNVLKELIC